MNKWIMTCMVLAGLVAAGIAQPKRLETWPMGYPIGYLNFYDDGTYTVDSIGYWDYRNMNVAGIANGPDGDLLFQTNGLDIVNKQFELIENGDTITDKYFYEAIYPACHIPQSMLVLPRGDNTYWVFNYAFVTDTPFPQSPNRLFYSIVDMNANGGAGRVTQKAVPLYKGVMGDCRLTAVRHANGRDWWLVNHGWKNDIYNKWLVTPDTIYGPFQQAIGVPDSEPDFIGFAQFTLDGRRYASANHASPMHIMDFDRCTGMFSNPTLVKVHPEPPWQAPTPANSTVDAVCWSPNGRYIYTTCHNYLLQYDTWADSIPATRTLLAIVDSTYANSSPFFMMALSPHGKIIVSNFQGVSLKSYYHIIHQPDSGGHACMLEKEALRIPGSYDNNTLPNIVNLQLGADTGSLCDTIVIGIPPGPTPEERGAVRVFPNPATEWVAIEVEHNRHFAGTLTVRNALGQTVYENQRYDGAAIIHTSALPSGMYVYYIQSKNNTWSGTFAVRR